MRTSMHLLLIALVCCSAACEAGLLSGPGNDDRPRTLSCTGACLPVTLTVAATPVAETSRMLLGQAVTHRAGHAFSDGHYKSLVKLIRPGMIRFPHHRYLWQRSSSSNAWYLGWGKVNGVSISADRRLRLAHSSQQAQSKHLTFAYQNLRPSQLVPGATYRLELRYQTEGLVGAPDRRCGAYLTTHYFEDETWWLGSRQLVKYDIPPGTSGGEIPISRQFVYDPASGNKTPAFIRLTLQCQLAGAVYLDDVRVISPSSGSNLVQDPGFGWTDLPADPYEHRFTSTDLDRFVAFIREVGAEPIWQWEAMHAFRPKVQPGADGSIDPAALSSAVLSDPRLDALIESELDVLRYANLERGYKITYWEFMNEPEIWWTWIAAQYNHGTQASLIQQRYTLYGRLYARIARRAKTLDPSIKLGAAVISGVHFKESVEGFLDGVRQHEEGSPPGATVPVPLPDFFTPHPYQLRAWGSTPACPADGPDNEKVCIDNLLTYSAPGGPASCDPSTFAIKQGGPNLDHISFFEPYFDCLARLLKSKNANPVLIPTEWESSGSTEVPYGRFGNEVWTADRLGRFARRGVFAPLHWRLDSTNGLLTEYGKIDAPYATYALFARFLQQKTRVLQTSTSSDDRITIYAFQREVGAPVHLVLVNLVTEEGETPVTLHLPGELGSGVAEQIRLGCSGEGCLYRRGATEVNGQALHSHNALTLLGDPAPTEALYGSTTQLSLPNHPVTFWKIMPPAEDTVPPEPAAVNARYDSKTNAIDFSWSWTGDRTCPGCSAPVGYCQPSGVSSAGFPCDNLEHPPFWWHVINEAHKLEEAHSWTNQAGNKKGVGGNSSNVTRFSVSCVGRAGETLRVDVDTRDANGNMVGGPPWTNVRVARATCPQ